MDSARIKERIESYLTLHGAAAVCHTHVDGLTAAVLEVVEGAVSFRIRETVGGTKEFLHDDVFSTREDAQRALEKLPSTRNSAYVVVRISETIA